MAIESTHQNLHIQMPTAKELKTRRSGTIIRPNFEPYPHCEPPNFKGRARNPLLKCLMALATKTIPITLVYYKGLN